ncbi:MAG: DUF2062 domain-containing protein [Deltaproteobacteria bacterium]|nr:DUF2062 domain-containing protein [Candidatus Anaeroferrophillus wilburensis]MBN2889313.1 DUF2062 domain-containing protein [Deltaproteobacteria bacterium]
MKKPRLRSMVRMLLGSTDDPATVARGLAAGIFVAFSPLLGIHTALAIALAFLLRGNRLAAVLASWVCNPVSLIPILYLDFRVGELLLGADIPFPANLHSLRDIIQAGSQVAWPLLLGGHLIGLTLALISFPLAQMVITMVRQNHKPAGSSEE